ncbi:hypothetical protein U1Q18_004906 [Sarracenia purpurea var. burkii]
MSKEMKEHDDHGGVTHKTNNFVAAEHDDQRGSLRQHPDQANNFCSSRAFMEQLFIQIWSMTATAAADRM